ncbi:MAG: hypothetical protein ABEJ28_05140 [Salinigranum sp.]
MTDNARLGLDVVWLVIAVLYLGPLAPMLANVNLSFGNVSFFAAWAVVIGPLLAIVVFGVNSYLRIKEDRTRTGQAASTGGD